MKMSRYSIGTRMAGALGLVLALMIGAALFGIAALYRTLGAEPVRSLFGDRVGAQSG